MEKTVLQVKDITKVFPHPETPVVANDHVNLTLNEGEILAVVGENGTGKSTLMNILYGMLQPDSGEILLDALEHYGERAQVDMILEEMAELSKALLKLRRAQKFREPGQRLLMEDVAEEIADVQIVLDQMKLLFPGWETWMQKKLQRLEERIEKERTKGAVERRAAGDRAAAAGGDGPAARRPPGDGGSGEAGPVQGESEAST